MREIKFRAWDNRNNTMVYQNGSRTSKDGAVTWYYPIRFPLHSEKKWPTNVELMQYTGLKDKNGKEIYEGDILTYPNDSFGRKYSISWADIYAGFWFAPLPISGMPQYGGHITLANAVVSEVIGNIYENPELLKEG